MSIYRQANQVLAHWPDRQAMAVQFRLVPARYKRDVGELVRLQQFMFQDRRYFGWCTVRNTFEQTNRD